MPNPKSSKGGRKNKRANSSGDEQENGAGALAAAAAAAGVAGGGALAAAAGSGAAAGAAAAGAGAGAAGAGGAAAGAGSAAGSGAAAAAAVAASSDAKSGRELWKLPHFTIIHKLQPLQCPLPEANFGSLSRKSLVASLSLLKTPFFKAQQKEYQSGWNLLGLEYGSSEFKYDL